MSAQHVELPVVSRITIDAVGLPGQRVFLLQASDAVDTITLKLEKGQARAVAQKSGELLRNIEKQLLHPESASAPAPASADLTLSPPLEPLFAVGQIGIGYDQGRDRMVLAVQELVFDESQEPSTAQFWISRAQLKAMSEHTLKVIEQGRPACPLCGRPMDPDGHLCPRQNGRDKLVQ